MSIILSVDDGKTSVLPGTIDTYTIVVVNVKVTLALTGRFTVVASVTAAGRGQPGGGGGAGGQRGKDAGPGDGAGAGVAHHDDVGIAGARQDECRHRPTG